MTIKEEVQTINKQTEEIKDINKSFQLLFGSNWYEPEYTKEDYDMCECSGYKKLKRELFCKRCGQAIEEKFRTMILKEFNIDEIKYIDTVIDGYYLEGYLKKESEKKC